MPSAHHGRSLIESLLNKADIHIDGNRPWDVRVHDNRVFNRVLIHGSLGLGESYMEGWWDCSALDQFFERVLRARIPNALPLDIHTALQLLKAIFWNVQTRHGSTKVAKRHYDIGNDLYGAMLDPYRQYSCGYFKDTDDLAIAQEQKMELICRKLQLTKTDRVLDIGCGWGGLAKYIAKTYGCHVTGLNISDEQIAYARECCHGLPVDIVKKDYRDMKGSFDKVVSVGMFEHVGRKNYVTYMQSVLQLLKPEGLFLLHTIGKQSKGATDAWILKYIFPHSELPTQEALSASFSSYFVLEDWHNFGAYYDKTLMAWHKNFSATWSRFKDQYSEEFERMWRYYLLSCAGSFRSRSIQLWQLVLSPHGVPGGYASVR